MPAWKSYYVAHSVPEALQTLAQSPGPRRIVAGGTDLLLDLQQGRQPSVHTLVDITQIPELTAIEIRDGRLFIGAAAPHFYVVCSPLIQEHSQALLEAAGLIGGPQVRNTATLGGNVAHALPAADGTIALVALDAQAEVANPVGRRMVPILELFRGPGKSALDPQTELLVGLHLPLKGPRQASAFQRIMRPQGVAIAILNLAAWLELDGECITDIRIAVGPAGPIPQRARLAEAVLRGQSLTPKNIKLALEALLGETHFRTSPHRATAEYRKQMVGVLLEEVVSRAWERAVNSKQ